MSLGSELKDFVSAFSVGANLVAKSEDRRYRRERDEKNDLFREGYDSPEQRDQAREFQRRGRELSASPEGGASSPTRASGGGASTRGDAAARERFDYWRSKGYSPEAAAGIVGNMAQESNFNPTVVGDRGTSYGEYQHRGPRWAALRQYAQENGKDPKDWRTQADFADHEMRTTHRSAFAALQRARSPQEAADAFALHFERPAGAQTGNANNIHGIGNRRSYAQKAFSWASQNAGAPAPTRTAQALIPGRTATDASPPPSYDRGDYEDGTGDEEAMEFATGGAVDPNYGARRSYTQAVEAAPTANGFVARRVGDAPRSFIPARPGTPTPTSTPTTTSVPAQTASQPQAPATVDPNLPAWGNYDPDTFEIRPQVMDKNTKQMVDPRSYVDELGEFKGVYTTAPVMGDVDPNSAQGKFRAAQQARYDRYVAAQVKYATDLQDAKWRDAAEAEAKRRAALRKPVNTAPLVPIYPPDGSGSEGGFATSEGGHHGGFDGGGGWGGGGPDGAGYGGGDGGATGGDTGTGGLYARGGLVQKFADGGMVEEDDISDTEMAFTEPSTLVPPRDGPRPNNMHLRRPRPETPRQDDTARDEFAIAHPSRRSPSLSPEDSPEEARERLQARQREYMDVVENIGRELGDRRPVEPPDEATRGRASTPTLPPTSMSARLGQLQRSVRVPSPPPVPDASNDPELIPPRAEEPAVAGPARDVMGLPLGHQALAPQASPSRAEEDPRLADMRIAARPRPEAPYPDAGPQPPPPPDDDLETRVKNSPGARFIRRLMDGMPGATAAIEPNEAMRRERDRRPAPMIPGRDANAGHPMPPEPQRGAIAENQEAPRRPSGQIKSDPKRIGRAVGEGMKRIQEEFFGTDFNFQTGTFPGERNVGQRGFAANAGAPSQEEMNAAFKKVDPKGVLSREDQMVKLLEDQRDFWLSQNRPERAAAATASILMYGRKVAQKAGLMAIAAADDGDINAAARFIQRAYEHIPDGRGLTFKPLGDGRVEYNITSLEDPVGKPRVATLAEVRTLATQLANGSAWAQQMFSTIDPTRAGRTRIGAAGGAQARPRAPTQKDRDRAASDADAAAEVEALERQAQEVEGADPKKAALLREQAKAAPMDRAYNANRGKTRPNRQRIDDASVGDGDAASSKPIADMAEDIAVGNPTLSEQRSVDLARILLDPKGAVPQPFGKHQWRVQGMAPFFATWQMMRNAKRARAAAGRPPAAG